MFKVILLIAMSALIASCQSDSNSKPITPEQALKMETDKLMSAPAATDFTKTLETDRIQIVKANLTYDEQKEMRTIGCKNVANGGWETDYKLDSELTVGQTFREETAHHNLLGNPNQSTTFTTVKEVRPDFTALEANFEALSLVGTPFTSVEQIFLQRPHNTMEKSYIFKGDEYPEVNYNMENWLNNFTAAAKEWIRSDYLQNPTGWSCRIQPGDAGYTSTVAKVMYNVMGRPTEAYMTESNTEGDVICEKRSRYNPESNEDPVYEKEPLASVNLGKGKEIYKKVVSNKFVTDDLVSCGGEDLYRSTLVTLDTGKIISSSVDKTLAAPFRTRQ